MYTYNKQIEQNKYMRHPHGLFLTTCTPSLFNQFMPSTALFKYFTRQVALIAFFMSTFDSFNFKIFGEGRGDHELRLPLAGNKSYILSFFHKDKLRNSSISIGNEKKNSQVSSVSPRKKFVDSPTDHREISQNSADSSKKNTKFISRSHLKTANFANRQNENIV